MWISDTRPIQCYSMTRVTVWLQCYGSQFSGSQFYGAKVLRLQFYGPNVRVPDTTEPRTWLIRQSASLLPPFAAVMSPSPPPPFVKLGHTVLPPLLLFVIPSNHQVPAPYLPFLLCSSYFPLSNPASTSNPSPTSTPIPNLPLSYFLISVVASTTTTTTTSSREEKTQWSVLLQLLQRKV